MISILGAAVVAGALAVELAGRRGPSFTAAIHAAPIWILSLVVLLQLVATAAPPSSPSSPATPDIAVTAIPA